MKRDLTLCIDIGGTHITTAVVERDMLFLVKGTLIHEYVDSQASKEDILARWYNAIAKSIHAAQGKVATMLVSIPGPFDYQNGICLMDGMHKYQSLLHMDVRDYLSVNFDIREENIFFFNDAHAFLLGEVYYYGWSDKRIVGLTLGTGLGSAWYDGVVPKDLNYGSARFRDGIAEDYISTRGIIDFLSKHTNLKFENIKELAQTTHAEHERKMAFSFLTNALIEFVRIYVIPLNPDAIVIGGSIAKAHTFFMKELRASTTIPIVVASMDEMNLFYGMITTLTISK